jgi:outer membrane lipoprotein carrier protein
MNSFGYVARLVAATAMVCSTTGAWADAAESLRGFVRDVKSGQSGFTQTVTSPDGKKQKVSSGSFSFARPNRFRFDYAKPYPQTIVSDGVKVWFHDPDLNQVTVRKVGDTLGSTPVALLTGTSIEKTFELKNQPDKGGLEWVQATPRETGGTIQWLKAGFKGKALMAVEIADSFGQRSLLQLNELTTEVTPPATTFSFNIPAGADVSEQ